MPFLHYVNARLEEDLRDIGYKVYVTDTLKFISGASERWIDRMRKTPSSNKTADEIIADMREKLGRLAEE